jgi:uncharacterized protein
MSDQPALNEEELETLGLFLEDEYDERDALDFFGAHGLLTALSAGPIEKTTLEAIDIIFDESPVYESETQKQEIQHLLEKLHKEIRENLNNGGNFLIPCELTLEVEDEDDESPIQMWCAGFMEGCFLDETTWYSKSPELIAELMLPIMYTSGLFDEEPEMQEIQNNPELENQLLGEIPDFITDLYLEYRLPDEKKGSKHAGNKAGKKPIKRTR